MEELELRHSEALSQKLDDTERRHRDQLFQKDLQINSLERKILELESNAQRDSILLSQQTKQIRELESSLA